MGGQNRQQGSVLVLSYFFVPQATIFPPLEIHSHLTLLSAFTTIAINPISLLLARGHGSRNTLDRARPGLLSDPTRLRPVDDWSSRARIFRHSSSLPSCSNVEADDFPTRTLENDARAITEALEQLVEREEKLVVVVMHS